MNIKGVQPFHLLPNVNRARLVECQMSVRDFSARRGYQQAHGQPIPKYRSEHKRNDTHNLDAKGYRVGNTGDDQEDYLQSDKGRIVPGPVILCLLPVVCRLVDNLRTCRQKSFHLVQSTLNVHLSHVRQSMQILHRSHRGRHHCRVGRGFGPCGGRSRGNGITTRGHGQPRLSRMRCVGSHSCGPPFGRSHTSNTKQNSKQRQLLTVGSISKVFLSSGRLKETTRRSSRLWNSR